MKKGSVNNYHGMNNPNEINSYLSSYSEDKSNFSFKDLWQGVKTIGAAPARGGFLTMLKLNIWNLSKRLGDIKATDPKKYEEIKLWWYNLGGNRTTFDKNVEGGKGKRKPIDFLMNKPKPTSSSFSECEEINNEYLNVVDPATATIVVTSVTAGSGIAIAMINKFMGGKAKYQKEEQVPDTNMALDPKLINKFENPELAQNSLTPKWVVPTIIIGSALVLTGVVVGIIKMRKKATIVVPSISK